MAVSIKSMLGFHCSFNPQLPIFSLKSNYNDEITPENTFNIHFTLSNDVFFILLTTVVQKQSVNNDFYQQKKKI